MRLPFILLVVSVATLLASDSVAGTKVLQIAPEDVDLMVVGLNDGDTKRFLRTHVRDNDEDRLGGKNMFNIEKLEEVLSNVDYAKTLFRRWKRHGFDVDKAINQFKTEGYKLDNNAISLLKDYGVYLKVHSAVKTDPKLFDKEKIAQAFKDGTYANQLYGRWRRYGFTSDNVIVAFKRLGVDRDPTYFKVYEGYFKWLEIHHPLEKTVKTTPKQFLFSASRIERAPKDKKIAKKLFAKWNASKLNEKLVYEKLKTKILAKDKGAIKLYEDYVKWLDIYHPLPAKAKTTLW